MTVIIPTRDESRNIRRFLASIDSRVELVVVDSSDDDTPDVITAERPERTTVIRSAVNIPVARQIGALAARTPWLIFSDADVTFRSDYFDRLTRIHVDARLGGLVGAKSSTTGYERYHRFFQTGQAALAALGIPAATGSNMLVRSSALRDVGGFDPGLTVNEDTELMFRVRRAGWTVGFRPDLCVDSFDHRRLDRGVGRKILHGAVRNSALYLGVGSGWTRRGDWGYWDDAPVGDSAPPGGDRPRPSAAAASS